MFGRGSKTSALGLCEIMQLEKEFPAPTTASILYFNSDGQVARGLLHPWHPLRHSGSPRDW